MRVPVGVLVLLFFAQLIRSDEALRIQVIDGDTVRWDGERVRLLGFDAPELHGVKCKAERELAARAKAFLEALSARPGARLVFSGRRDKYGRPLAVLTVDGRGAAEIMITHELAHPYDGKKKLPWCGE